MPDLFKSRSFYQIGPVSDISASPRGEGQMKASRFSEEQIIAVLRERPINPVLVVTGNELLDPHGPPYCWDKANQRKFSHIDGIIDLCDATQQIYLGLDSWRED
jgi:hypothetical protein